ncbi:MAG: glycosyltransferase family 4 protein [Polyangiaceae bacterium]
MAKPIAYVMEQTLGSITHYQNLRREDDVIPDDRPRWLPIDFKASRLPWTVTGSLRARRAIGPVLNEVDGIFVHTTTLAPLSVDYFLKKPAIISSDGTPLNKRNMRAAYGLKDEHSFAQRGKQRLFRELFARCAGFVAWSNWTKQSFVEDYGCPEQNVAVIPPGVDLDNFSVGDRNHDLPRVLFVGGDFRRKGGDLLLQVFRSRLRGRAELVLVTPADVPEEPGVTVHRNLTTDSPLLGELYRTCDLFVLPTRADCYALVCMEALAAGLPLVITRVGGLPDMVREGETGHVVDIDDAAGLGDALESIVASPALRNTMSQNCRADAVERFSTRENARRLFEFVRSRC